MSMPDDLVRSGLIEAVQPDRVAALRWLEDAERHLDAAIKIAGIDPSGAYFLAYHAARKSVAAALLISGYRVLSRPGSHQALAQFAVSLARQTEEQALTRFDRVRRNRNQFEYGSRTFGVAEVSEAIDTARAIRTTCASLI